MSATTINVTLLVLLFTMGPVCIGMFIRAGQEDNTRLDDEYLRMVAEAEAFRLRDWDEVERLQDAKRRHPSNGDAA